MLRPALSPKVTKEVSISRLHRYVCDRQDVLCSPSAHCKDACAQDLRNRPPSPPMNKCFSPYPSLLLGGNEGGGGNWIYSPQGWGASGSPGGVGGSGGQNDGICVSPMLFVPEKVLYYQRSRFDRRPSPQFPKLRSVTLPGWGIWLKAIALDFQAK